MKKMICFMTVLFGIYGVSFGETQDLDTVLSNINGMWECVEGDVITAITIDLSFNIRTSELYREGGDICKDYVDYEGTVVFKKIDLSDYSTEEDKYYGSLMIVEDCILLACSYSSTYTPYFYLLESGDSNEFLIMKFIGRYDFYSDDMQIYDYEYYDFPKEYILTRKN